MCCACRARALPLPSAAAAAAACCAASTSGRSGAYDLARTHFLPPLGQLAPGVACRISAFCVSCSAMFITCCCCTVLSMSSYGSPCASTLRLTGLLACLHALHAQLGRGLCLRPVCMWLCLHEGSLLGSRLWGNPAAHVAGLPQAKGRSPGQSQRCFSAPQILEAAELLHWVECYVPVRCTGLHACFLLGWEGAPVSYENNDAALSVLFICLLT